jgi:hypothetical protein
MKVSWTKLKSFIDDRALSVQFVEFDNSYWLKGIDGGFELECDLLKSPTDTTDLDDFETNYKPLGNQSPKQQVTTQYELNDKDLHIACMSGDVDTGTGIAISQIVIPGTPGSTDGRWVAGGEAFFDHADVKDRVIAIDVVDVDNLLGLGAGTVVKTYHDEEVAEENRGWYIGVDQFDATGNAGIIEIEPMGYYGFIPAGLYLRITAKKDPANKTGTFRINIAWGKPSP